ncbi:pseudouridine synthase [Oceanirhabdus seepicola]|uniref:Pseudouridine synthase n=1 Tax=Oceanirhabdus seepicola TaxID=2828781 RepID=A0A9J6P0V9_9CLOT|nr:pseudouridine synthase [Oceanirhabdus seepicola]MCM1990179.1 rRNA pseudouridine synthase [Oceanirhabdus seepicola]
MERLDKILSNLGRGSRKEVKAMVRNGWVEVNGVTAKKSDMKIDTDNDIIVVDGEEINYREFVYIMMNKPAGYISATFDNYQDTVVDILEPELQAFEPFPIGRLDKDTVGLLLLTNDGKLNHRLISPKNHIDKVYFADIDKAVDDTDVKAFEEGITLEDGYKCMPGKLEILKSDEHGAEVMVTIQEGKFHQVKRMFKTRGKEVVFLKRMEFGGLKLDETLPEGDYRELSNAELKMLKGEE